MIRVLPLILFVWACLSFQESWAGKPVRGRRSTTRPLNKKRSSAGNHRYPAFPDHVPVNQPKSGESDGGEPNKIFLEDKIQKKRAAQQACFRHEPEVGRVVEVAWLEARVRIADDRSREGRVRWSGWLPKVSGGISKNTGGRWDFRYEPGTPRVDQLHHDDGWSWDVGVVWDPARGVFQKEELQVSKEASRRSRERMDIASEVIRLYFRRRQLLLSSQLYNLENRLIQLHQTTALLNAWTGNRFVGQWCQVSP